jgi:hypothetical protein
MPKITCRQMPFILTFVGSGQHYLLTSEEAQRLLDAYPAVTVSKYRVMLQGHNTSRASDRTILRPATRAVAFDIERSA